MGRVSENSFIIFLQIDALRYSLLGLWFSSCKSYQWLNIIYQILSHFTYLKYVRNLNIQTIVPHKKHLPQTAFPHVFADLCDALTTVSTFTYTILLMYYLLTRTYITVYYFHIKKWKEYSSTIDQLKSINSEFHVIRFRAK